MRAPRTLTTMCRHRPPPPLSCPSVGPNRPPVGRGGARAPPPPLTRLSIIGRRLYRGRMRRPGGTAPGTRACGAARPFRSTDHAGAVQGLRRRTPRGRSRAGSSNVAEGDVGARAGAGGRRSWCLSSGARCRTSVAADSRGTAPSRRVRRDAAARVRPTSPPARLGPCTICRAISWRCGVRAAGAGGRRPDLRRPRPDLRRPRPPRCTVRTAEALTALRTPPPSRSSRR